MGKEIKKRKHSGKIGKQPKLKGVIKNNIENGKHNKTKKPSKAKLAQIKSELSVEEVEKTAQAIIKDITKIQSDNSEGKKKKKVKLMQIETAIDSSEVKKPELLKTEKGKPSLDAVTNDMSNTLANNQNAQKTPQRTQEKSRHDSKPGNTIFIGNLPSNTKKKQLEALFNPFGKIVSVRFRTSHGKKLFKHETRKKAESINAYVVFDNEASKSKALSLSGTEFKGMHIRVTSAKDFTINPSSKATVFVGNLKYSATDEKLYDIFSSCGELDYVRTFRNEKGCSGMAIVCFKKPESVTLAFELNNTLLDDRPIRVQRYKPNEPTKDNRKVLTGPARRLAEKKRQMLTKKSSGNNAKNSADVKMKIPKKEKKKSDYHGKKMSAGKKPKNKKKPTHLQKLAKKIAPK